MRKSKYSNYTLDVEQWPRREELQFEAFLLFEPITFTPSRVEVILFTQIFFHPLIESLVDLDSLKAYITDDSRNIMYLFFVLEKRIQEIISVVLCIFLMIYNFFYICYYFDVRKCFLIIPSARMLCIVHVYG